MWRSCFGDPGIIHLFLYFSHLKFSKCDPAGWPTSDTIFSISRRVHARCLKLNDSHLHIAQTCTWLFPPHPSRLQRTWMAGRSYFESKAWKNHSRLLLLSHAVGACWPKRVFFIFIYLFWSCGKGLPWSRHTFKSSSAQLGSVWTPQAKTGSSTIQWQDLLWI